MANFRPVFILTFMSTCQGHRAIVVDWYSPAFQLPTCMYNLRKKSFVITLSKFLAWLCSSCLIFIYYRPSCFTIVNIVFWHVSLLYMLNKITYYLLNLTSSCWQLKTYRPTATQSVSLLHSTETAMHWLLWDALASGGSWQTASDADRIAESAIGIWPRRPRATINITATRPTPPVRSVWYSAIGLGWRSQAGHLQRATVASRATSSKGRFSALLLFVL